MSSLVLPRKITSGFYPERRDRKEPFLNRVAAEIGHTIVDRIRHNPSQFQAIVPLVNNLRDEFRSMTKESLQTETVGLRIQLRQEGIKLDNAARSFALIREVAQQSLGMTHYDVQLVGGWTLLQGMVAEMETGEGKTLTATFAAYLNAVHQRLHQVFADGFLQSLEGLPGDHPLSNQEMSTHIEIALNEGAGPELRFGIERQTRPLLQTLQLRVVLIDTHSFTLIDGTAALRLRALPGPSPG